MIKKIDFGKTNLKDLHQVFKLSSHEALDEKKARLFPSGNSDNEVSTTSIFLASLSAVKEYREELFLGIGINKLHARNAVLHVYTELHDSVTGDRPDALLVITSGKLKPIIEWACFIESKVGENEIVTEQIEKYATFAREIGINDIITISNHLVTNPYDSLVKLKKRNFKTYHWSWTYLKVTASRLVRTNSVEDVDHIYILKELRRYFDSHKHLRDYKNMGKEWKDSINKIHSYHADQKIENDLLSSIVNSYKQEEKDISLQLTDRSECHVELLAKKDRTSEIENSLQTTKLITSSFMVNHDRKKTFSIEVDFIRQEVACFTTLSIEKGKARAQTTALIKIFEDIAATSHIIVNAYYNRRKSTKKDIPLSKLIEEKSQSEFYSILDKDLGDEVKFFELKTADSFGKDFQNVKSFIVKIENIANRFLTQIMINIH